jgi:hypothetical protein
MEKNLFTRRSYRARGDDLIRFAARAAGIAATGLLFGCASEPESRVVSAPPPPAPTRLMTTTTTTSTPASAPAPAVMLGNTAYVPADPPTPATTTTVVTQAPPELEQEVVLARPSPQDVWLAGYWTWQNDRYEWMAGHWQLPPNSNATWVAPRWEHEGNAYRFYEGHWN